MRRCAAKAQILSKCRIRHSSQSAYFDAVALPRSLAKLIDTVGGQIGLFLEPYHIRRKGQAEADVTVAKAKAKAEIAVVRVESKLAIQDLAVEASPTQRIDYARHD